MALQVHERGVGTSGISRQRRTAMYLSLVVGLAMLAGKVTAYTITGSAAILSDAAESVIHVAAVAFAVFALRIAERPADARFPYGYERVAFFSAGFEGAMIVIAALWIIVAAIQKWVGGIDIDRLGLGTLIVAAAAALNLALGLYLVHLGRRTNSIILEANGKHVLTDSWTSAGVIVGLLLVMWTGWRPFDPLVALAVAFNILWSGAGLMRRSVVGLMDYSDPALRHRIEEALRDLCGQHEVGFHGLRFRHTGQRLLVELHLLFEYDTPVGDAHRRATDIEERLARVLPMDVEVVTHLEAVEDHERVHRGTLGH
jgi:cation diffusion facilitator family transporter